MQILCKWARRNSIWCHNVCSFRREKEAQTIKRVSRRNANGEMSLVNCRWRGGAVRERHGREMRRFVCLAVLFLVVTRLVWKGNWWMTFDSDSTRVVCCSAANMADCLSGCQLTEMAANTGKKKRKISKLTRLHLSRNVAENERHCQAQRAQQTILHFLPSGRQLGSCFATKIIRKWFILPRTLIHSFDLNNQPRNFQI